MTTELERLFDHIGWANQRLLTLLGTGSAADERSLRLFAHVLAAERVWLARLRSENSALFEIWPTLSKDELYALAAENRDSYARYLGSLAGADLDEPVAYRNSKGEDFRTPVRDILMHVALHGAYHRGQIALALRASGAEPVNTDYITFAREVEEVRR